ncbi:hypothetical protein CBM2615_A10049 [Cupriavidus taiwanensis]|uniref:Uncharacterized protein n=1 Tax=Cupriavidus taiwanensis TaxID=164546 RepID=A0A976ASZ3_9BURK|nr:hypothetical protein CBM2614_A10051 [Cupriavidus taiwanensis]SOZ48786.1 hypothetical protein CBM2615_A10049 [Cupriavidus taiwanensis]SOZ51614.1 hypothetical protein CBM2613_A10050 [Cupriavidus taiwanensis]SPA03990.1 hypothetical protein CBM2625_A10049 [Cupriavidus taiwanensis]
MRCAPEQSDNTHLNVIRKPGWFSRDGLDPRSKAERIRYGTTDVIGAEGDHSFHSDERGREGGA